MRPLVIFSILLYSSFSMANSKTLELYSCQDNQGTQLTLKVKDQDSFSMQIENTETIFTNSDRVKEFKNTESEIFYSHEYSKFYRHPWFGTPSYLKTKTLFEFNKFTRSGSYYNYYRQGIFSLGEEKEFTFTCE